MTTQAMDKNEKLLIQKIVEILRLFGASDEVIRQFENTTVIDR